MRQKGVASYLQSWNGNCDLKVSISTSNYPDSVHNTNAMFGSWEHWLTHTTLTISGEVRILII